MGLRELRLSALDPPAVLWARRGSHTGPLACSTSSTREADDVSSAFAAGSETCGEQPQPVSALHRGGPGVMWAPGPCRFLCRAACCAVGGALGDAEGCGDRQAARRVCLRNHVSSRRGAVAVTLSRCRCLERRSRGRRPPASPGCRHRDLACHWGLERNQRPRVRRRPGTVGRSPSAESVWPRHAWFAGFPADAAEGTRAMPAIAKLPATNSFDLSFMSVPLLLDARSRTGAIDLQSCASVRFVST